MVAPVATDTPSLARAVREALLGLEAFLARYGDRGWDPYDALNSPVLRALTLGLKYPRIACTQALRRLPVNLRPLLGIRRTLNPKGLGLLLTGTVRRLRTTGDARYGTRARELADLVLELRSEGCHGAAWGYPFPWQSRAFHLPRWTPTVVNTSFVAHALVDAADALGEARLLDVARSSCDFVLTDLNRVERRDELCFSYTPLDRVFAHNASMLGASLLARVGARTGEARLLDAARAAARHLIRRQRPDGSWWYAEPEYQHWIDSFHTGFVLESLARVARHAGMDEAHGAIRGGHRFFLEHFFEEDGLPKYYCDRRGPIDIHCPAQALVTIPELWDVEPAPALLARAARWFLERMRAPEGYFYFRLGPLGPNRIPYLRWGQAWAYHGLARLEAFLADSKGGGITR